MSPMYKIFRTTTLPRSNNLVANSATVVLLMLAMLAGLLASATPADANEDDLSEAYGQLLDGDVLGLDLADAGSSRSAFLSSLDPEFNPLNVALLDESATVDLGGGLQLPLIGESGQGLLQLGQLGLIHSYAHADNPTRAVAAAGTITEDGAIAVDPTQETGDPARVDLTLLFDQLNVTGLTDEIIDGAGLNIGALASRAEANNGNLTRDYALSDLTFNLSSPLVGELTEDLGGVVESVGDVLNGAAGTDGVLGSTISALEAIDIDLRPLARIGVTEAELGLNGIDAALATVSSDVLQGTITSDTGLVSVNLDDGTITLDLEHAMSGGLNGQPANTQLITAQTLELITDELTTVLTNLVTDLRNHLATALEQIELVVDLGLEARLLLPLATGGATITGSLADFLGTSGTTPEVDVDLTLAGLNLGTLVTPLLNAVLGILSGAVGSLLGPVLDGVLDTLDPLLSGVLTTLNPVLSGVVEQLVQLTINEQETTTVAGHEAHSVTALGVTLLPLADTGAVDLNLATSTVRALDEYAEVVITSPQDDEVIWGDEVEVQGTAHPGVDVEVELDGQTSTVTADDNGSWSATFTDVSPGDHTATATDQVTEDSVDFVVRIPVDITAPTPDEELLGDTVPVNGTAAPNTEVTVTLCAADEDCPTADSPSQTTQTDAAGNWSVEFSGVAAGQYTAVATDEFDDDEVTFHVIYEPVIQLDPDTVVPDSTTTVTGGGFAPGEDVVVMLPDADIDGDVIPGYEVTTTADPNGDISVDIDIPADYPTGAVDITAEGPVSATPATASLTVIAPVVITTPTDGDVFSGGSIPVTGTAEPGTEVTVTLCEHGADCPGENDPSLTVPVDEDGNWTTTFDNVPGGQYTITATDGITDDAVNVSVPAALALPLTGGPGQWTYFALGGLLLMLALWFAIAHQRRKGAAHRQ